MSVIKHSPTPPGIEIKADVDQWRFYAARGYTTVTELAYSAGSDIDQFLTAVVATLESEPQIQESSNLWVAGRKIWTDGSPHCGTAVVSYLDTEFTR